MRALWSCCLVACLSSGTLEVPEGDTPTPTPSTTADPEPPTTTVSAHDTGVADCPPVTAHTRSLVVTDIDETLTTSDLEWLTQIALPGASPEMRPDADLVIGTYFERGYAIAYVTARGEGLRLLDGTTARRATEDWLTLHGFPFVSDAVFLAPGLAAFGGEAADYKIEVLQGLLDDGYVIEAAYGNSDTDIEAYLAVGVPEDRVFLVGKLAGQFGVVPIPTSDAYGAHLPLVEANVPCASR